MLPPSWKREVQKTVEEATERSSEEGERRQREQSSAIASTLATLIDHFKRQAEKDEGHNKIKIFTDALTIALVFGTALFTALSWLAFRDQLVVFEKQLHEMEKAYGPIQQSADAARDAATSNAGQLAAMNRQLAVMEADQRPWIAYVGASIETPLHYEDGKAIIGLRFIFKNVGRTPARFVLMQGTPFILTGLYDDVVDSWKDCDERRKNPVSNIKEGKTIFPNQEGSQRGVFVWSPQHIERLKNLSLPAALMISGCIDYLFQSAEQHHQTRFVYELDKKGPNQTFLRINPAEGDLPIESLALAINPAIHADAD
jgi:hypothetical protein